MRSKIVSVAQSMLHVVEDDGRNKDKGGWIDTFWGAANDSYVNELLGRVPGVEHRDEWCAAFASWVYASAGLPLSHRHGTGFTGAGRMIQWLEHRGAWVDSTYDPQPGDLIFIDWQKLDHRVPDDQEITWRMAHDNVDHVGVVEAYDAENEIIHTIEGNLSGGVNRAKRTFGSGRVIGFGNLAALL